MPKQVGVTFDDDLYEELVRRAGGVRKISKYLNPLLRVAFSEPDSGLVARLVYIEQRLAALEKRAKA